jgi:hypothetical protein
MTADSIIAFVMAVIRLARGLIKMVREWWSGKTDANIGIDPMLGMVRPKHGPIGGELPLATSIIPQTYNMIRLQDNTYYFKPDGASYTTAAIHFMRANRDMLGVFHTSGLQPGKRYPWTDIPRDWDYITRDIMRIPQGLSRGHLIGHHWLIMTETTAAIGQRLAMVGAVQHPQTPFSNMGTFHDVETKVRSIVRLGTDEACQIVVVNLETEDSALAGSVIPTHDTGARWRMTVVNRSSNPSIESYVVSDASDRYRRVIINDASGRMCEALDKALGSRRTEMPRIYLTADRYVVQITARPVIVDGVSIDADVRESHAEEELGRTSPTSVAAAWDASVMIGLGLKTTANYPTLLSALRLEYCGRYPTPPGNKMITLSRTTITTLGTVENHIITMSEDRGSYLLLISPPNDEGILLLPQAHGSALITSKGLGAAVRANPRAILTCIAKATAVWGTTHTPSTHRLFHAMVSQGADKSKRISSLTFKVKDKRSIILDIVYDVSDSSIVMLYCGQVTTSLPMYFYQMDTQPWVSKEGEWWPEMQQANITFAKALGFARELLSRFVPQE